MNLQQVRFLCKSQKGNEISSWICIQVFEVQMGFLGRLGEPWQVCLDYVFPARQGRCISLFLRGAVKSSLLALPFLLSRRSAWDVTDDYLHLDCEHFKLYKGDPLSFKSIFFKLYSNFHIAKIATEDMVKVVNNLCNSSLFNLTRQVEPSEILPTQSKCAHPKEKDGNENLPNTKRGGIWGNGIMFTVCLFSFS